MKHRTTFVTISMPVPLRDRLNKKVQKTGAYGSTSDYVRDLIRRDLADEEDEGRRAYLNAKAGIGLSPVFETAEEGMAYLRAATKRAKAKDRKKR